MKKLFSIVTCLLFCANAFAQDDVSEILVRNKLFKNTFFINPGPLFAGGLDVGLEIFHKKQKKSVVINVGYYLSKNAGSLDLAHAGGYFENMEGLRVDMQYRLYRKPNNYIKNLYIGPFLTVKTISANDITETKLPSTGIVVKSERRVTASAVGFGYLIGIKQSIYENFYFDINFGGSVTIPIAGNGNDAVNIPIINPYIKSINPRVNFGFGIAF